MGYGLQLYSVRDFTSTDIEHTFSRLKEFGFEFFEFAGYFGHSAGEIKDLLIKYDYGAYSSHISYHDIVNSYDDTVAFHKELGIDNFVIPIFCDLDISLDTFIDFINEYQPRLEKDGIKLHFHNHDMDLIPDPKTGRITFDELEAKTNINFQLDTYWTFIAGRNACEIMDRLSNRISFIHIKDGDKEGRPKYLGRGAAPVIEPLECAKKHGFKIIIESEGMTPDGITEAKRCIKFLKKHDAEIAEKAI